MTVQFDAKDGKIRFRVNQFVLDEGSYGVLGHIKTPLERIYANFDAQRTKEAFRSDHGPTDWMHLVIL